LCSAAARSEATRGGGDPSHNRDEPSDQPPRVGLRTASDAVRRATLGIRARPPASTADLALAFRARLAGLIPCPHLRDNDLIRPGKFTFRIRPLARLGGRRAAGSLPCLQQKGGVTSQPAKHLEADGRRIGLATFHRLP
jgi:hypothetical protein